MNYTTQNVRKQLFELADEKYKDFSSSLIPNSGELIGVSLPELKALAKSIAADGWREYLDSAETVYFEEIMLYGFVIGFAKADFDAIEPYIRCFVPGISNWSVCDSVCAALKVAKKQPERMFEFLGEYFLSENEFDVRFAVVMLNFHFVKDEYICRIFEILDSITHEGYYVRMACAWCISTCLIKFPGETLKYLEHCSLDDFTFNKALQKSIESYRVKPEMKELLRRMKRRQPKSHRSGEA
ncbi:MAG: DNA alkylation repair protein [Clostridiales bacterium]|nr:DNA alkylation repair protein [Clostridiales bacterium]